MSLAISTNEGGLSNRIKSWVSCYRITPNNENVRVYWPILDNYETKKHILNCSFNKLFTNNIEIENLSSFKNSNDNTISIYNSHCLKIFDSDKLPMNFNTFNSQCAVRFIMNDPMRRNIDFMYNKIPIELIQEYRELFKIVKPIPKLQDKIDTFGSKFNGFRFVNNNSSGSEGGGICIWNSTVDINATIFDENQGAIYLSFNKIKEIK